MSDNATVVTGLFDAVNRRRLDLLGDFLSPEVIDHNKIIHGEDDRPGAAFDGIAAQLAAFDPLRVDVADLVEAGDRVVARVTHSGMHTGSHPRMPRPTGRRFHVEAIWWLTIVNGRITEIRAVADRLGMFAQLGWDWPHD